jgi:hypothetical protein
MLVSLWSHREADTGRLFEEAMSRPADDLVEPRLAELEALAAARSDLPVGVEGVSNGDREQPHE